jgi:DNA-binding MarR family transcriptional regulator
VALADKLERRNLIARERGSNDRREVLLRLTPDGSAILRSLSALHRRQVLVVGPAMVAALQALVGGGESDDVTAATTDFRRAPRKKAQSRPSRG